MSSNPIFTPTGTPEMPAGKIGVLLVNLGTPDDTSYWSMRRYLSEFLSDKRVVDMASWKWQPLLQGIILSKRPFSSGRAYDSIWNHEQGESPLLTITKAQSAGLQAALGSEIQVEFAMRYGNPSIAEKLALLQEQGCDRILYFPLYPQYAGATVGSANDGLFNAMKRMKWQPSLRIIRPYYDHPGYIDALATSIRENQGQPDVLVLSFHGLPERYITMGDPYYAHCVKTTQLVQAALDLQDDQIKMTFQSKFGRDSWIKPSTVDGVADLARAGKTNIAVVAPGFAADCIETLEEINEEVCESFTTAGGKDFTYIPCLNDRDDHISMMTSIISTELGGWI